MVATFFLSATPRAEAQACPAVTPLTLSCGNASCDFNESEASCVSDCADRWTRAVGYYAEYSNCPKSEVHHPASVGELQRAVRELVAQNKTVKLMGTGHSTARNYCSEGGVIVTSALKGMSEVELWQGKETVVFEAGVTYTELTDHLAARGKWLGYTVVGFGPINAAGGVATGIHGSNLGGTAAISSRVLEIDMVRQDGSIATVSAANTSGDEWRALRANLGALGGMARIRVEVDPLKNIRGVSSRVPVTHAFTQADIDALVEGCDYAFMMFYPASDEWVRFCGTETSEPALSPLVVNNMLSPDVTEFESTFFQTSAQFSACHPAAEKLLEQSAMQRMGASPIKVPDGAGGFVRVSDAVGPGHRMVTIDGFPSTQPQFSQYDFEASLPHEDAAAVLNFINERFDRDGRGMPLVGALVRFDQVRDDTLFGSNAPRAGVGAGRRIVHIELPVYRPFGFSEQQLATYLRPYTDIMEHIVATYPSALLHFGKNTLALIGSPAYRANIAPQVTRFQKVVDVWDPFGVYRNEYLEAIGLGWPRRGEDFASFYLGGPKPAQAAVFEVQGAAGRCLAMPERPNFFGLVPAVTAVCPSLAEPAHPRRRFFVRDVESQAFVASLLPGRQYSIHPEESPFGTCLNHVLGLDYTFAACNGSTAQAFALAPDASGVTRIVAANNGWNGCMDDRAEGDELGTGICSASGSQLWKFSVRELQAPPQHTR